MGGQTAGQGAEEGEIQDVRGVCGDNDHSFSIILDNIITVGESAEGEERAGQPLSHPRDL